MTKRQVKLNFGFIKQLCKKATGLVHTNFFSYFNPITGRSEHIDQRDSGDFNYPLLLADTSNNNISTRALQGGRIRQPKEWPRLI